MKHNERVLLGDFAFGLGETSAFREDVLLFCFLSSFFFANFMLSSCVDNIILQNYKTTYPHMNLTLYMRNMVCL